MTSKTQLAQELAGTHLIITALLLEREGRSFAVTDDKLDEATKWHVDAEVKNGEDVLFLTPAQKDEENHG